MRKKTPVVLPLKLNDITIPPERMRKLRPEVINELAESIKQQGLLQPIVARPKPKGGKGYVLIAGRHRLEAVRQLGLGCIMATVLDRLTANEAELAEIDENLVRAELTPIERDLHVARRKQLYERQHPETKRGSAGGRAKAGAKSHRATQRPPSSTTPPRKPASTAPRWRGRPLAVPL